MAAAVTVDGAAAAVRLTCILLFLSFAAVAGNSNVSTECESALLDRQEALISRLETLISRLEALQPPQPPSPPTPATRTDAVSVVSRRSQWSERFHFVAAANTAADVTAAAVLPLPVGGSRYFAAGDSLGRLYLFSTTGDVIATLSNNTSPVTAILAYLVPGHRYDCLIFTGHLDGTVISHRIAESNDEYAQISSSKDSKVFVSGLDGSVVNILDYYTLGRSRYVISADSSGRIRIFTENGTLYGTAISRHPPIAFAPRNKLMFLTQQGAASLDFRSLSVREVSCDGMNGSFLPMAYTFDPFERSKAYGLTVKGDLIHVVILGDVANMKCRVRAVREQEIEEPVAIQALKGYLLVTGRDKVHVYNTSSQYHGRAGAPRPLFVSTLKEIRSVFSGADFAFAGGAGATTGKPLIVADREKLVVLGLGDGNIIVYQSNFPVFRTENNSVLWTGPVLLFLLFLIGIWQVYTRKKDLLVWSADGSFSSSPAAAPTASLMNHGAAERPFADSARAGERPYNDGVVRTGERSFVDSVRTAERTFADGVRTGELAFADGAISGDLVTSALRAPARRYVSPSRFSGASGVAYRPVAADQVLRGPAELKYRGPGMEPPGFPKRRDPLFTNTQPVDDHTD